MTANKESRYTENLRRRRDEVDLTLRHLENERREVEANTQWASRAAYDSRVRLLERLTRWYRAECSDIDAALERARTAGQSRCAACHAPLDSDRRTHTTGSELCAVCAPSTVEQNNSTN